MIDNLYNIYSNSLLIMGESNVREYSYNHDMGFEFFVRKELVKGRLQDEFKRENYSIKETDNPLLVVLGYHFNDLEIIIDHPLQKNPVEKLNQHRIILKTYHLSNVLNKLYGTVYPTSIKDTYLNTKLVILKNITELTLLDRENKKG